MDPPNATMAQQVAEAARAFQQQCTGHAPKGVNVILSGETLVITLHDALSPAEKAAAGSQSGAEQLQEFYRQLFVSSAEPLRQEIRRITGVKIRRATAHVEPKNGTVVQVFTTGTIVQVFHLAEEIPPESWSNDISKS